MKFYVKLSCRGYSLSLFKMAVLKHKASIHSQRLLKIQNYDCSCIYIFASRRPSAISQLATTCSRVWIVSPDSESGAIASPILLRLSAKLVSFATATGTVFTTSTQGVHTRCKPFCPANATELGEHEPQTGCAHTLQ